MGYFVLFLLLVVAGYGFVAFDLVGLLLGLLVWFAFALLFCLWF